MCLPTDMQIGELPFAHAIIDGAFPDELVAAAAATWPATTWPYWSHTYDNPVERKRVCNDWQHMPAACQILLNHMLSIDLNAIWSTLETFIPDGGLYGGGMHALARGGHLDIHEDADVHRFMGWRRRANAILFLNPVWQPEWHGQLEFWDKDMTRCLKRFEPRPNRLVIFFTDDGHFHGVPETVNCPESVQRMSLATFWFSAPDRVFKRLRANFVSRPGDPHDPAKVAVQAQRSHSFEV